MDSDITKQPLTHAGSVLPLTGWEFVGRGRQGEPRGTGRSGHAGHLTGCGGRLWRERWLNGSDVGRLQGTAEGGHIRTGMLVTDRTAGTTQEPFSHCGTDRHVSLVSFCVDCFYTNVSLAGIDVYLINQTWLHVFNRDWSISSFLELIPKLASKKSAEISADISADISLIISYQTLL